VVQKEYRTTIEQRVKEGLTYRGYPFACEMVTAGQNAASKVSSRTTDVLVERRSGGGEREKGDLSARDLDK